MSRNIYASIGVAVFVLVAIAAAVSVFPAFRLTPNGSSVPENSSLPVAYTNQSEGFSIRLPSLVSTSGGYRADETYRYQNMGPGTDISGVKFTIPASLAAGTNLSQDSYLSVEEIPQTQVCTASLFLDQGPPAVTVTEGDTTYSVASSTGAAVGNRYEETVYALPGTDPCTAVRYYVHYGAIENYPPGQVSAFDRSALLAEFDRIRKTLVLSR